MLGGALNLAIGLFPSVPPALDAICLFQEKHRLYCGQGHPLFDHDGGEVSAEDLQQSPYVSWAYQESYVSGPDEGEFNVQGSTPFMEGLVYLVLSGLYIGYLPRHSAQRWVDAGRLRQLSGANAVRKVDVTLISRRSQRPNKIASAFRTQIERVHGVAA